MAEQRGTADGGSRSEPAGVLADDIRLAVQQIVRQEVQKLRREMEQQLRERDEAIGALLGERMQRVEERLAAVEERAASTEASSQNLQDGLQRALSTVIPKVDALLVRLGIQPSEQVTLSNSLISNSISNSTPTSAPSCHRASTSAASSSASTSASAPSQLPAASALAAPAEATTDEEQQRLRVLHRMKKVWEKMNRARKTFEHLGEELCIAAYEGRLEDVRRLLDSGVDVNCTSSHGGCPLTSAFSCADEPSRGDPAVVRLLLSGGADVNAIDERGWTALHWASSEDDLGGCVALLLGAGADTGARNGEGATPLHLAALRGNEVAVRALLAAGADRSLRCWSGLFKNKRPVDVCSYDAIRDLLRS